MKKTTKTLTENLRPLTPLDATALARVTGGESASTSTSGTPEAGDDTIGDSGGSPPSREPYSKFIVEDVGGTTMPL